jgi:hypothetical protein
MDSNERLFRSAPLPGWEEARKVATLLVEVATPRDGYTIDHALAIAELSRRVGVEFDLSEDSDTQSTNQDGPAGDLQNTWARSASMSGREFERFMADLLRAAGYRVDVVGVAGTKVWTCW